MLGAVAFLITAPLSQAEESANINDSSFAGVAEVGEISLVLGKAYLQRPGSRRQRIQVGLKVRVSDKIATEGNGHVHIRFVDQALVSVRPDSRLEVVRYYFDPQNPEQSAVKFNLLEGVARAISGEAAKAAKQRFRMNTPIAAIGVRGTDFVVSATQESTRALVNEGVIVVSPYSVDCSYDGLASCSVNGVELTENSLQAIELNGANSQPKLLALADTQDPERMRAQLQQEASTSASDVTVGDVSADQGLYSEESSTLPLSDQVADDTVKVAEATTKVQKLVAQEPDAPEPEPELVILDQRQLVWGRYVDAAAATGGITVDLSDVGESREVTVGNFEYGLFRTENGSKRIDSGLTVVSFSLAHGQATYRNETGSSAMEVTNGSLDIDFQQSRFATQLNLSHTATGQIDFTANGRIFDGGYFHSRSDDQKIGGAVSLDGQEAGYFFERQIDGGDISGLTLWDGQ